MALSPKDRYAGQIDETDPVGFPNGKARNVSVPGDGTGTPFERDLVNDLFGFQQAILAGAGATPTNVPDQADDSQYLDGLQTIIGAPLSARITDIEGRISPDDDWVYPAVKSRTVKLPMSAFEVEADPSLYTRNGPDKPGSGVSARGTIIGQLADGEVWASLALNRYLPSGAVLQRVRVPVTFAITGTSALVELSLERYGVDYTNWVASGTELFDTVTTLDTLVLADGSGRKLMDSGGGGSSIGRTISTDVGHCLVLRIQGNNSTVHGCELIFDDPGPRNT